jgi:hypothetical protein
VNDCAVNDTCITAAVGRVMSIITSFAVVPFPGAEKIFPGAWCDYVSLTLVRYLEESCNGGWRFVDAGVPEKANGHAWVELWSEDGQLQYVVDMTVHQLPNISVPHLGRDPSPAASLYTEIRYRGAWREWPVLNMDPSYERYSSSVLALLKGRECVK